MTQQAVTLMAYGKPASPPSHSPWKTLRVSHRLTASTTGISPLTSYRGTHPLPPAKTNALLNCASVRVARRGADDDVKVPRLHLLQEAAPDLVIVDIVGGPVQFDVHLPERQAEPGSSSHLLEVQRAFHLKQICRPSGVFEFLNLLLATSLPFPLPPLPFFASSSARCRLRALRAARRPSPGAAGSDGGSGTLGQEAPSAKGARK